MPVEVLLLRDAPVPLQSCPNCQFRPFEPFLRGQFARSPRTLFSWPPFKLRPHVAVICWACKEIVGWEAPEVTSELMVYPRVPEIFTATRSDEMGGAALAIGLIVAVLIMLFTGCASAPPARSSLPVLPPAIAIAELVPPAVPFVVPPNVPRYPDRRVSTGQCPGLPAGILVSPAVFAERHDGLLDRERLQAETRALEQLRVTERQAAEELAEACRVRAAELEQAAVDAGRWTSLRGLVLFAAGALIGGVFGYVGAGRPVGR